MTTFFALLTLCCWLLTACAKELIDSGAETSVALSVAAQSVPAHLGDSNSADGGNNNNAGSGNSTNSGNSTPIFSTTSSVGLAIQHVSSGGCMQTAQASSAAAPSFVVATCAARTTQRWVLDRGHLSQDGAQCLTAEKNGVLGMAPCVQPSDGQRWTFLPFFVEMYNGKGAFVALPTSGGGLGSSVVVDSPNATLAQVQWQPLGAAGQATGAPLLFRGDANQCLMVAGSALRTGACSMSDAGQMWSSSGGVMRSDSGVCLSCDVNQRNLLALACSPTPANSYFYIGNLQGLRCLTAGNDNTMLMPVPNVSGQVTLQAIDAAGSNFWTYGGARYLAP